MDLAAQAEQLMEALPRSRLEPRALAHAEASAVRRECWLVALSGGADSVALLLLLWALWPAQRTRLTAVHFNHRLRGAESDEDEAFCRRLCAGLGVRLSVGAWETAPASPSEEEARDARFRHFEAVREATGSTLLFTGHQKDDIAETQLMRLARGASSSGLAAPRPVRPWTASASIVRPLLSLAKHEIAAALAAAGIAWREDSSNQAGSFLRNRIRRDVVPVWLQAAGAGALEGAGLTRGWLEDEDDALEAWLDELGVPPRGDAIDFSGLMAKPRALWRRALRRWNPAGTLSRAAFDDLLTLLLSGRDGRMSVGVGFAVIRAGQLTWGQPASPEAPWASAWLAEGGLLLLPDGAELRAQRVAVTGQLRQRVTAGEIDPETTALLDLQAGADLCVRARAGGDRYRPLGAPGVAKLQDLFVNRKVPADRRGRIPVICAPDGRILWVPGFPPAEESKLTDVSVTAVQLTYLRGTSTVPHHS